MTDQSITKSAPRTNCGEIDARAVTPEHTAASRDCRELFDTRSYLFDTLIEKDSLPACQSPLVASDTLANSVIANSRD